MNFFRQLDLAHLLAALMALFIIHISALDVIAESREVNIYAAASVTNAITELGEMYTRKTGVKVVPSFGGSSTLAKQIENGAPAGIFISADIQWMNYLDERKLLLEESRFDLLGNRLALICPVSSNVRIKIEPGLDLATFLGNGLLATGDPDHVPAGKYARAALEKLGMWTFVSNKLARASDVRSALTWVERDEAPLGIVYATDAAISRKVRVADYFPEDSYPRIVYPVALLKAGHSSQAAGLLDFLKSNDARKVFEKYGFLVK